MDFNYVVIPALIAFGGILIAWFCLRRILLIGSKSFPTWRKATAGVVLSLVGLISLILAGSSGWNAIALRHSRSRPPGKIYLVNGHRMRIDCMGSGSPVIILESGAGGDGLDWGNVQPLLAKTTRTCSYDRAGMGWSDALPPPRDADHVATELNGLLTAAQIVRPVVLMGASRGGIFIRDYATRYPAEVAGLIFVDTGVPLQQRNPAFKADAESRQKGRPYMLMQRALFYAGIPRLVLGCPAQFPGLDERASKLYGEDQCHQSFDGDDLETDSLIRSGEETVHTGPYCRLPILIFSHDPATVASGGQPADLVRVSENMQEDLKKLSARSRRIIAKGSGHRISWKRPELIEREVSLFIERIRGTVPEPTDYGSTTTE